MVALAAAHANFVAVVVVAAALLLFRVRWVQAMLLQLALMECLVVKIAEVLRQVGQIPFLTEHQEIMVR
jgi:hypothetical protein